MSAYRTALEASPNTRSDILEGMLDSTQGTLGPQSWTPRSSVRTILEELSLVCREKDAHVSEGFGSSDTDAREWRKLAKRLESIASRLGA